MTPLRLLVVAALLQLSLASTALLGFSTRAHFRCAGVCERAHDAPLSSSALSDLVAHLSQPDAAHAVLPVSRFADPPQLLVVVRSAALRGSPPAVLQRLSVALTSTHASSSSSSFHAVAPHALPELSVQASVKLSSVDELLSLTSDASSPTFASDGRAHVVSLSVEDEREPGLLAALEAAARRANGDVAVVWAVRADADADADADAPDAPKEEDADAAPQAQDAGADTDAAAAAVAASSSLYGRRPYRLELTETQLAGLLVTLVFIIVFVPGFMCLWRIQPPQAFDSKMQ